MPSLLSMQRIARESRKTLREIRATEKNANLVHSGGDIVFALSMSRLKRVSFMKRATQPGMLWWSGVHLCFKEPRVDKFTSC